MKSFANCHPLVLFIYYCVTLSLTIFLFHPIVILLSLIGALTFFIFLVPTKRFFQDLGFYFFVFLFISLTNPLFVHKGETILFFLNDNPVTLEAINYGLVLGVMLVAVMFWSKSYSELMTTDKFIYLFGKIIPKLSLVISMSLRYVPMLKVQIRKVHRAQKTLGLYTSNSITDRILSGIRTFNSVLSWSFETAIDRADSMKARGYGLKGRTNYSIFKWYKRDIKILGIILILLAISMYFINRGLYVFEFYPAITRIDYSMNYLLQFVVVLLLMILPSLIELKENLVWNYLKSKI